MSANRNRRGVALATCAVLPLVALAACGGDGDDGGGANGEVEIRLAHSYTEAQPQHHERGPEHRQRIAAHITQAYDRLTPLSTLAERALAIAGALDHSVYDCFYLALAEVEAGQLVTADRRLLAKVTGTPFADWIRLLGET